nr:hypothetical protein [bacterium]
AGSIEAAKRDWIEAKVLDPYTKLPTASPPGTEIKREVAYEITPDRLKSIKLFRDAAYSNAISNSKISFEAAYSFLYIEAEAYDLQAISDTNPYANDMLRDTANICLKSESTNDSITVTLIETAANSNIFRNWITIPVIKQIVVNKYEGRAELEATRPDTIQVYGIVSGDSSLVKLYVENYKQPEDQYVLSLRFYTNSSADVELSSDLVSGDNLYIKLLAAENASAAILIDTKYITIHRNLNPVTGISSDSITVMLTETAVGSEIYKVGGLTAQPKIYYFTDNGNNYILGSPGDIISLTLYNDTLVRASATVGTPKSPDFLYALNAYKSSGQSSPLQNFGDIENNSTIYLEAIGDYGNSAIADTTSVKIENITKFPSEYIILTLTESGINTGKYYGNFRLEEFTNMTRGEIGVAPGDSIRIVLNDLNCDTTLMNPYPRYIKVAAIKQPANLNSLRFMKPDYSAELTGSVPLEYTLYIEARGADGSELTIDTMSCKASSNEDTQGISVELIETEKNSGQYRGYFKLMNFSDDVRKFLKATVSGCSVVITAVNASGEDT